MNTAEKTITKSVPLIARAVSGGTPSMTVRPMGGRRADAPESHFNGDFDVELDLNPRFATALVAHRDRDGRPHAEPGDPGMD